MRISPQGLPSSSRPGAHFIAQPPCQRDAHGHINPAEIMKAIDLSGISGIAEKADCGLSEIRREI
jgi:hypothetical protein